jgi:hypothetical protein
MLLYPTLLIALLTAVPEWVRLAKSWESNVPADKIDKAEKQTELWKKNLECTTAPMDFFANPSNIKVDATICESGDVFVRVFTPDDKGVYYWVDIESLIQTASNLELFTTAQAFSQPYILNVQSARRSYVMCQRFLDERNLLRVVNVGNECFDEVVDTYTGQVTSRDRSQCRENC